MRSRLSSRPFDPAEYTLVFEFQERYVYQAKFIAHVLSHHFSLRLLMAYTPVLSERLIAVAISRYRHTVTIGTVSPGCVAHAVLLMTCDAFGRPLGWRSQEKMVRG